MEERRFTMQGKKILVKSIKIYAIEKVESIKAYLEKFCFQIMCLNIRSVKFQYCLQVAFV